MAAMAMFDLPVSALREYVAAVDEPSDFDAFWRSTLAETRAHDLAPTFTAVDAGLRAVDTYDVEFSGFDGHRIKAWLHLPAAAWRDEGRLPGVVQYLGYGNGRGLAHENVLWALAGYAHLVMDTRGQGTGRLHGDTADPIGSAPSTPGFMTRGIRDPQTYYYRRVFTDAVRAVEALRAHEAVDAARVAVTGVSQGGGISLAVGRLLPDLAAVMPDVPFLCDMRHATEIIDEEPYAEISSYLKVHREDVDRVFATLAYFDGVVMARRAPAPALFSVGLMDETCPPSTVYGAFNSYAGPKEIVVYPYNDHEGGQGFQQVRQLSWVREHLS